MRRFQPLFFLFLAIAVLTANQPGAARAEEAAPAAKAEAPKPSGSSATTNLDDNVSGGRFAGDPVYVHLSPMILPVISDEGAEQLITIIIDVEVKDFDIADLMHVKMPKVRDSLMSALYGGLGRGTLRNGKLVDVTKIKSKATTAINQVMGGDNVRAVLIQGVAQRML